MIVLGLLIMFIAWALPQVFPDMAPPLPALDHIAWVLGVILLVVGLILLLLQVVGHRTVGNRRFWY